MKWVRKLTRLSWISLNTTKRQIHWLPGWLGFFFIQYIWWKFFLQKLDVFITDNVQAAFCCIYAVLFCFVVFCQQLFVISGDVFTQILQGCFTDSNLPTTLKTLWQITGSSTASTHWCLMSDTYRYIMEWVFTGLCSWMRNYLNIYWPFISCSLRNKVSVKFDKTFFFFRKCISKCHL